MTGSGAGTVIDKSQAGAQAQARAANAFILAKILSQATSKDNNRQPRTGARQIQKKLYLLSSRGNERKQNTNRQVARRAENGAEDGREHELGARERERRHCLAKSNEMPETWH